MAAITIDFGSQAAPRLARLGLKIASAKGSLALDERSYFEAPAAVQTILAPRSLIQVGCFASLAGGHKGNVRIGRYTSIALGVVIGAHEHPVDWLSTSRITHYPEMHDWHCFCAGARAAEVAARRQPFAASCPLTETGNDVWIGHSVFIKAGVRIGDGAIIGARAVVVKDVEPYTVVVGAPAKARRLRFEARLVERLLAFRWWRFSLYDVLGVPFDDPEAALDQIAEREARGELQEYKAPRYTAADLAAHFAAQAA